uniref:Plastid lipid-associated protein/fibrillin conserved domain-containing protein n=1 Tax=Trieres chinensis TaxID=1514140 RepID=A0A7S1ZE36_TRICV|mmetsp:Transcript_23622/g.47902  ORF Transcript_23622/g.47902 Transcript_23622/m.47902 type:complete len:209 (+) Transcript_23622:115-741(+)
MIFSNTCFCIILVASEALALCQPNLNPNNPTFPQRRAFLSTFLSPTLVTGSMVIQPKLASADLNSAATAGVPLVGRFEQLKGANAFIGVWRYTATKGIPEGELVFLKNGDVELRSAKDSSTVIGIGAVPWKYISPKGTDTMVTVTFTLDEDDQDNVLIFQGTLDSAAGPDRTMEGEIATGRAEIGARGGGPIKKVGTFKAQFKTTETM